MDTRKLDHANPLAAFDLLNVFLEEATGRELGSPDPVGWRALAEALTHCREERERDRSLQEPPELRRPDGLPEFDRISEQEVRTRVVAAYLQQSPVDVVRAKLRHRKSLMSRVYIPEDQTIDESLDDSDIDDALQQAICHWHWFLESTLNCTDPSDGEKGDRCIVPLDIVDLQVAASVFNVQITVTRLMDEPMRFRPRGISGQLEGSAHLASHGAFWAPLLRMRWKEPVTLTGAVVKLKDEVAEKLGVVSDGTALVHDRDVTGGCYVVCLPECQEKMSKVRIERDQITTIILPPEFVETERRSHQRITDDAVFDFSGHSETSGPLAHIPRCGLEWYCLHELVRRTMRDRLEGKKKDLAGRDLCRRGPRFKNLSELPQIAALNDAPHMVNVTAPNTVAISPTVADQDHGTDEMRIIALDELDLDSRLQRGEVVRARAIRDWHPRTDRELMVLMDMTLDVSGVSPDRLFWLCYSGETDRRAWVPVDVLLLWKVSDRWSGTVETVFQPEPSWPRYDQYLPLRVGNFVSVFKRFTGDWEGWARGEYWGQHEDRQGDFPLDAVVPMVMMDTT